MAFNWIYFFSRSKNTNFLPIPKKQCPRETDDKLLRYPCNLLMFSYIMVTMWAVSMHLMGAYDSFNNPFLTWVSYMNPPVRVVFLKKKRKPPDRHRRIFSPLLYTATEPVFDLTLSTQFLTFRMCLIFSGVRNADFIIPPCPPSERRAIWC